MPGLKCTLHILIVKKKTTERNNTKEVKTKENKKDFFTLYIEQMLWKKMKDFMWQSWQK